jgi:hypothetical protein
LLRKSGATARVRVNASDEQEEVVERISDAKAIWDGACESDDKPTEYLKGRGINIVPRLQAVHITWLTRDGTAKIAGDRPRETRGGSIGMIIDTLDRHDS